LVEAYLKAYEADTVSAYGGIIACNREVDEKTALEMAKLFVEAIIAPSYSVKALSILTAKKNLRLLEAPVLAERHEWDVKRVSGGFLLQTADCGTVRREEMQVVTKRQPTEAEWEELLFAWRIVKHVKSNAIVVTKDGHTIGVGAGQMNRVGAAKIAFEQAGEATKGAVLSSDAFFPFRDTIDEAAKAGVTAVIQPGGSIRDAESIAAADEAGIAMIFTGRRHFKH
jgi:phosphoribosylaminoimidazolecarboxamide formyltransferase/IMP cyclohydrolase